MTDTNPAAEQGQRHGSVAPQTPHSTGDPLDRLTEHEIHEAIRKMARINPRGFRALVARAGWTAQGRPDSGLDSRTDSQDNRQDSTVDNQSDNAPTSADRVRTSLDTDATIRRQLEQIVGLRETVIQREAERDQAYRERAHLLAWLAALHPANAVITPAADIDEPGWQLLYLLVSGWQMSWHIHPRDAELFAHVQLVPVDDPRAQWDGHSSEAKYQRIHEHTERLSEARAATSAVSIDITPDPPHVIDAIRQVRRDGGLPPHRR